MRPRPAQSPLRPYVACFSRPSMELAARNDWNVIYAPFAAAMVYGSLADAVRAYRDACEQQHRRPMRRAMCSYFIHIASNRQEERYGREALVRYFQDALIAAFPSSSGEKVPPTYRYFADIVNILRDMRPEKLTDKSILCGSPQHIVDTLKQVEQAGIAEVILYFNYGRKPHALVKEQMQRFMSEVAIHFDTSFEEDRVRLSAHA